MLLIDAARRKQQQDELPARLALIEQNRLQCQENARAVASQRVQEAHNQTIDVSRGYRRISIEDFVLDAADLASQSKKVSLQGSYILSDNVGVLFADQLAIFRARSSSNVGGNVPSVPLLTNNAARPFRQFLLQCQANPATAQAGCRVAITGTVTTCKATNVFGVDRELPCIDVDDGRPL